MENFVKHFESTAQEAAGSKEQFALIINNQAEWNKCRVDKFAACYYVPLRKLSMKIMLVIRLGCALITTILLAGALYNAVSIKDFMLYYSHWSLLMLLFMFVSATATTLLVARLERTNRYYVPCYVVCHRLLYNVAGTANLVSSAVYVIILFLYKDSVRNPVNHVVHSFNSLLVIIEFAMNAIPMRLAHIYQPLLYTLGYCAFAAAYHYTTGEKIYKCLPWDSQQEMAKICLALMLILFVIYMLLYTIGFIKNKCLRL